MIRSAALAALPALLVLGGCNKNASPGNDREARLDAAPTPAPQMTAAEALSGIATEAVQAETMSDTDVASLGGRQGKCMVRLTRVGFPSFIHNGLDGTGIIKLNGKLIPLRAERKGLFVDGGLRVAIRPVDDAFSPDGIREADMILMLPGAKDEIGYRGLVDCSHRTG